MSSRQIKYTVNILLLLYVGYFGCVSIFVHKHVYDGVVYIHSHPYKKASQEADSKENKPPFETHKHTSAGFFTLNQLSNHTSCENDNPFTIARTDNIITDQLIDSCVDFIERPLRVLFRHRAPPTI